MNNNEIKVINAACVTISANGLSFVLIAQRDFGESGTAVFTSQYAKNKRARTDMRKAMRELSPKITIAGKTK